MVINGDPVKVRQRMLSSAKIVDLLVELLACPVDGVPDEGNLTPIFLAAYDVIHTYMRGCKKNCLYFAKNITFLQQQLTLKPEISLSVVRLIVELIRDNRKVVDRISPNQIDWFVALLRKTKNYRFLELLNVLCVCDGVGIPANQNCIVQKWLNKDKEDVYLIQRGQFISLESNLNYVSMNGGRTWTPLHTFLNPISPDYSESKCQFLHAQLDLFANLCYGHNSFAMRQITHEYEILTWDQAMFCLRSEILPADLRAKYCRLIT